MVAFPVRSCPVLDAVCISASYQRQPFRAVQVALENGHRCSLLRLKPHRSATHSSGLYAHLGDKRFLAEASIAIVSEYIMTA
jgi:hypothetical protein